MRLSLLVCLSALASVLCASAQKTIVGADTLLREIDGVTITNVAMSGTMQLEGQGEVRWNMSLMNEMPKILGNADPMHYAQTLPGVQTNNEYDGGLHILGCDNTHNFVGIDDVPIYNAAHLLGIFSVFNPTHFEQMSIRKTATRANFPNRIGGLATMNSWHVHPDSTGGSFDVGLISSQGTLRLAIGQKASLTLSARGSYLNQFYGYALKVDESQLNYSFADANATWLYTPNDANTIWVEAYWGGDRAAMQESSYQADARLGWGNTMAALHWRHNFRQPTKRMEHSFYYSSYHSRFNMQQQMVLSLLGDVHDVGYKGAFQSQRLKMGTEMKFYALRPSVASVEGVGVKQQQPVAHWQHAVELSAYADCSIPLSATFLAVAGVRTTAFLGDKHSNYYDIAPSVALRYVNRKWHAALTSSFRSQYLWQMGFSSLGLPTENWTLAGKNSHPLQGLSLLASAGRKLYEGKLYAEVEMYFKQMKHLSEYSGTVLDLLYSAVESSKLSGEGSGRAYGASVTIEKTQGQLTGWVAYNIGWSKRQLGDVYGDGWYAANHERRHELNIVATCRLGKQWNLGATFVWASGTPFTMPEFVYVYGGQLLAQFSKHNVYRLKPYSRLDFSASYKLPSNSGWKHGINLSVYNVLGRSNELFYSWHVSHNGDFCFRPISFLLKAIPSISYYATF